MAMTTSPFTPLPMTGWPDQPWTADGDDRWTAPFGQSTLTVTRIDERRHAWRVDRGGEVAAEGTITTLRGAMLSAALAAYRQTCPPADAGWPQPGDVVEPF